MGCWFIPIYGTYTDNFLQYGGLWKQDIFDAMAMINVKIQARLRILKDTPYPILTGELWSVFMSI